MAAKKYGKYVRQDKLIEFSEKRNELYRQYKADAASLLKEFRTKRDELMKQKKEWLKVTNAARLAEQKKATAERLADIAARKAIKSADDELKRTIAAERRKHRNDTSIAKVISMFPEVKDEAAEITSAYYKAVVEATNGDERK